MISEKLPEDIVHFINGVHSVKLAPKEMKEVQCLLPAEPVCQAVLYEKFGGTAPTPAVIQAAEEWIRNQHVIQTEAILVQNQLELAEPYTREQAIKGEVPKWMGTQWATELLYLWADGLQRSVTAAQNYLETRTQ
jgi:hypothetical protein